jgi:hypothetical protein
LSRVPSVLANPRIEHHKALAIIDIQGFEKRGWQKPISDPRRGFAGRQSDGQIVELLRANFQHSDSPHLQSHLPAAGHIGPIYLHWKIERVRSSRQQHEGIGAGVEQKTQICMANGLRLGERTNSVIGRPAVRKSARRPFAGILGGWDDGRIDYGFGPDRRAAGYISNNRDAVEKRPQVTTADC